MKKDQDFIWTPLSVEHIVQDEWIDFRKVKYRYPDGRVFEPFYQYSRRSYSVIVPVTEDGQYLCVRQFRHGIGEVTTEFPAGGIEPRKTENPEQAVSTYGRKAEMEDAQMEDALICAKRELEEETGYVSDKWTHLITIPSNATVADNYAHVYLARDCRKITGQSLDETEDLEAELLTVEEVEHLIKAGKFQQSVHVMAYLLAQRVLA
ncbi:NUDIX hydrolase [Porcincola intestinalis]|uniref:NUDIX hydrolase n=1 Tax=Porcincola intestinalis TaxID=2606632 RepID=UPI0023F03EDD|nr:NUDIX hydrolase [Porcincola intestinalis]MDD7060685.1 NUDIX hydrolase [Porcincola intestinalis]MDY5282838.1 NUDIX hydrolase [Porcincola intestinalis]